MPDDEESPIGFTQPSRPRSPQPQPAEGMTATEAAELREERRQQLEGDPEGPMPSGLEEPHRPEPSGPVAWLRQMVPGRGNHPLGSPEGRGVAPNPAASASSRGSTNPRRVVDMTAMGVRVVTKVLDRVASRFIRGADMVATVEEAYGIAGPLAGWALDNRPESGPIAAAIERAGLVGAGIGFVDYGLRAVVFMEPGGRAEAEQLEEKLIERMGKTIEGEVKRFQPSPRGSSDASADYGDQATEQPPPEAPRFVTPDAAGFLGGDTWLGNATPA